MLAERAFNEIHAWGTLLKDRPHQQDEIGKREGGARMVRTFEPLIVPGLLQTAEYARQVFDLSPLATVREGVPAAVSARMDRQLALYDPGQRFEFLITEASLRWCPGQEGRGLLPAQLDRVHSLSTLRNVSIGVIRDGAPALTYAAHGFVIYEGRDADDVCVGVEAVHAGMALHDPDVIEMYERTWTALKRTALFGDEARQIVIEHLSAFRVPAE
nr:DUF5753 domain-containing protein [Actinomadura rayongensis]